MKKENIKIIIAFLLVFIGLLIGIYHYYDNLHKEELEIKGVELFFEETIKESKTKKPLNNKEVINYIAVLEIPKINLKRGLVNPDSLDNDVSKNIEILKPVEMPDKKSGTFILASHSGNSNIAYFDRLNELTKGDLVFVYYKGIKYHYKITNSYTEDKDGTIIIKREKDKNVIVLTTCKKTSKDKQLVYIGNLIEKEEMS